MSQYNLSAFVKEQKKQKATIKLGDKIFPIKYNAWSYLKIQDINSKYKDNNVEIAKNMIHIFLGKEALDFIEKHVDVPGKEQIIGIIVTHVFDIDLSKKDGKEKK